MPGTQSKDKPVLVTASQKEKLGYEQPEGMRNSSVQTTALEHRDEIYAVVKPFVEERLGGREIELVGISAPYPYAAVDVTYRTVEEPIVASYVMVGVGDIEDLSASDIAKVEPREVQLQTVFGLALMAYRGELTAIEEHLRATYPKYVAWPEGYSENVERKDPEFYIDFDDMSLDRTNAETAEMKAAEERIYAAYQANPTRSDAEWRQVFDNEAKGIPLRLTLTMMTKSPEELPDEAMLAELKEDMKTNAVFKDFAAYSIFLYSNLRWRDGLTVHEMYSSWYNPLRGLWSDEHRVDGSDVKS